MSISDDYLKAKKIGERNYRKAAAEGRYPYLPSLEDFLPDYNVLKKTSIGVSHIPINLIVGTLQKSRQNLFSEGFFPLAANNTEFAYKWDRLYESQMEEGIREPIQVVEYLKKFYVVEGNKRVSIMNYVGMRVAEAAITRVLPEKTSDPEIVRYYAFTEFYKAVPLYEIDFSKPQSYKLFAELLGRSLSEKWPEDIVRKVRSSYVFFESLFNKMGGQKLSATAGDALLAYLRIFPLESLSKETAPVIQSRIKRLWNEFESEANESDLIEQPEDEENKAALSPLLAIFRRQNYTKEHPLKVAFLYERSPEKSSWLYNHMLGQNYIEQTFEGAVSTMKYTDCADDEKLRAAVDDAVEKGVEIIFTTNSKQMDETLRCAIHFPKVRFLNCSVNLSHNAVRTYYARLYEAKFLLGALAAVFSENHRIGYLSDMPVYGSVADINAFAIGASFIDPQVEIVLKWSMQEGCDWQKEFEDEGIRVISSRNMIRPEIASRAYGLYRVRDDHSIENLALPVVDWGKYYEMLLRKMIEEGPDALEAPKNGENINYWWGMSAGVVDIIPSVHFPEPTQKLIRMLKSGIQEGWILPFEGPLRSNDGAVRADETYSLTSREIITMSWLNENIIGSIPSAESMNEDARETMHVIGAVRSGT